MIFQSVGVNYYSVIVVPQDLAAHNIATLTTPALEECFGSEDYIPGRIDWHALVSNITSGNYERLTLEQCADFTKGVNQAGTKSILALADGLFVDQGGDATILGTDCLEDDVFAWPFAGKDVVLGLPGRDGTQYYDWRNFTEEKCIHHIFSSENTATCSDATNLLQWVHERDSTTSVQTVDKYMSSHEISNITVHLAEVCEPTIGSRTYSIQGCLAVKTPERCQLLYSPPFAIVIVLTTLTKVTTMFLSARISSSRAKPFLVIGDAVSSFMLRPDPTTEGKCWLSSADIRREN
ncbi:hypothetical protein N7474_009726 [Penicillium riverlandense]|uniref:uncharacterized protein n=1 Tax=Penicillium riverlandense TaxID=1903569 RepID=UPI002547168D|nr:uncharacterized protein N7474_009726 [Penicillium riverlandense]KAJ5808457.1 hypothetical protein N7474_009726 [Penicillium riverlandense]